MRGRHFLSDASMHLSLQAGIFSAVYLPVLAMQMLPGNKLDLTPRSIIATTSIHVSYPEFSAAGENTGGIRKSLT
jgi:hypothetical protein